MPPLLSKKKISSGLGCLTLFALPFAGIGTFMAYLLLASLWSHAARRISEGRSFLFFY